MRRKSDEKTNLDFKGFKLTFAEDRKEYDKKLTQAIPCQQKLKYNCMLGLLKRIW